MRTSLAKRLALLGVFAVVGAAAALGWIYTTNEGSGNELLQPPAPPVDSASEEAVINALPITFSHTDTFYDEDISVELSAKDKNAEIYYTTDGSDPTEKSSLYKKAINIRAGNNVGATTIKAVAKGEDGLSEVVTKSYVTGKDVFERFDENTYVFVLSADPYDLYDYTDGIAVAGKIRDDWLNNEYDGFSEIKPTDPANWNQSGMAGERPMYMEVYDYQGNKLIEQQAGARVAGGYSRATDQKSWKLIARRMYTPDEGMFHFEFFDDATDQNGMLLTEYDRIVLRNGANDREFAGVRDELSAKLAQQAGFPDAQCTAPAAVFLNGEYYGFSWLHQNFCNGYLQSKYGGNKDNFKIIGKAEGAIEDEEDPAEAEEYNELLAFVEEEGLTSDENFEKFCSAVDIDNYMMYLAMQLFIDNRDWPGNNYKVWRYKASDGEEVSSPYLDGKWRYLFFDAEFAWGLYSDGFGNATLTKIMNGSHPAGGSALVCALMEREDMREKLANNICDLIGGAFSTANILKVLEEKCNISDSEQFYALDNGKTSTWANRDTFNNSRNEIIQFALRRKDIILRDIRKVCELEDEMYTVNVTGANGLKIKLNTQTDTVGGTLSADYFTPYSVTLSAESFTGWKFAYFEINGEKVTDDVVTISSDMADAEGVINITAHAEKTLSDMPVYVSEVYTGGDADWIELYNPNDTAVTLKDMYLTDNEAALNRWSLPTVTVDANKTLTIVCKNNKASDSLMKLQTNFSLKTGETLILSDSAGTVYARVPIADCSEDESQTRRPDGTYQKTAPTEGRHKE